MERTKRQKGLPPAIRLLRVEQWVKNGFLFLPAFFAGVIMHPGVVLHLAVGAILFSLAASAVYVFNDLQDVAADRQHPRKCHRPIASGEVGRGQAVLLIVALLAVAIPGAWWLNPRFAQVLAGYLAINLAYSLHLKHYALLDVSIVALGFLLRVHSGGILGEVPVSQWIELMVVLLALFIALAKRRDDLLQADNGAGMRRSISGYNLRLVDTAMVIVATITIQSYILYTVSDEVVARMGSDKLYITSVFVLLGILRYFQLCYVYARSGSPTKLVLTDLPLQLTVVGWLLSFVLILYAYR
ncbi:MAG: UbiA prenyltransferase family protein [Flavobacteriales bacterium]|nr:UbiA prenyltransferase family protein [Flavobacteriales bacterium]MCB9193542.1 UbiA prenyltransferase family protein [Flavobacteriales bacterium]